MNTSEKETGDDPQSEPLEASTAEMDKGDVVSIDASEASLAGVGLWAASCGTQQGEQEANKELSEMSELQRELLQAAEAYSNGQSTKGGAVSLEALDASLASVEPTAASEPTSNVPEYEKKVHEELSETSDPQSKLFEAPEAQTAREIVQGGDVFNDASETSLVGVELLPTTSDSQEKDKRASEELSEASEPIVSPPETLDAHSAVSIADDSLPPAPTISVAASEPTDSDPHQEKTKQKEDGIKEESQALEYTRFEAAVLTSPEPKVVDAVSPDSEPSTSIPVATFEDDAVKDRAVTIEDIECISEKHHRTLQKIASLVGSNLHTSITINKEEFYKVLELQLDEVHKDMDATTIDKTETIRVSKMGDMQWSYVAKTVAALVKGNEEVHSVDDNFYEALYEVVSKSSSTLEETDDGEPTTASDTHSDDSKEETKEEPTNGAPAISAPAADQHCIDLVSTVGSLLGDMPVSKVNSHVRMIEESKNDDAEQMAVTPADIESISEKHYLALQEVANLVGIEELPTVRLSEKGEPVLINRKAFYKALELALNEPEKDDAIVSKTETIPVSDDLGDMQWRYVVETMTALVQGKQEDLVDDHFFEELHESIAKSSSALEETMLNLSKSEDIQRVMSDFGPPSTFTKGVHNKDSNDIPNIDLHNISASLEEDRLEIANRLKEWLEFSASQIERKNGDGGPLDDDCKREDKTQDAPNPILQLIADICDEDVNDVSASMEDDRRRMQLLFQGFLSMILGLMVTHAEVSTNSVANSKTIKESEYDGSNQDFDLKQTAPPETLKLHSGEEVRAQEKALEIPSTAMPTPKPSNEETKICPFSHENAGVASWSETTASLEDDCQRLGSLLRDLVAFLVKFMKACTAPGVAHEMPSGDLVANETNTILAVQETPCDIEGKTKDGPVNFADAVTATVTGDEAKEIDETAAAVTDTAMDDPTNEPDKGVTKDTTAIDATKDTYDASVSAPKEECSPLYHVIASSMSKDLSDIGTSLKEDCRAIKGLFTTEDTSTMFDKEPPSETSRATSQVISNNDTAAEGRSPASTINIFNEDMSEIGASLKEDLLTMKGLLTNENANIYKQDDTSAPSGAINEGLALNDGTSEVCQVEVKDEEGLVSNETTTEVCGAELMGNLCNEDVNEIGSSLKEDFLTIKGLLTNEGGNNFEQDLTSAASDGINDGRILNEETADTERKRRLAEMRGTELEGDHEGQVATPAEAEECGAKGEHGERHILSGTPTKECITELEGEEGYTSNKATVPAVECGTEQEEEAMAEAISIKPEDATTTEGQCNNEKTSEESSAGLGGDERRISNKTKVHAGDVKREDYTTAEADSTEQEGKIVAEEQCSKVNASEESFCRLVDGEEHASSGTTAKDFGSQLEVKDEGISELIDNEEQLSGKKMVENGAEVYDEDSRRDLNEKASEERSNIAEECGTQPANEASCTLNKTTREVLSAEREDDEEGYDLNEKTTEERVAQHGGGEGPASHEVASEEHVTQRGDEAVPKRNVHGTELEFEDHERTSTETTGEVRTEEVEEESISIEVSSGDVHGTELEVEVVYVSNETTAEAYSTESEDEIMAFRKSLEGQECEVDLQDMDIECHSNDTRVVQPPMPNDALNGTTGSPKAAADETNPIVAENEQNAAKDESSDIVAPVVTEHKDALSCKAGEKRLPAKMWNASALDEALKDDPSEATSKCETTVASSTDKETLDASTDYSTGGCSCQFENPFYFILDAVLGPVQLTDESSLSSKDSNSPSEASSLESAGKKTIRWKTRTADGYTTEGSTDDSISSDEDQNLPRKRPKPSRKMRPGSGRPRRRKIAALRKVATS